MANAISCRDVEARYLTFHHVRVSRRAMNDCSEKFFQSS
jgi:hypothetical protein